MPWIIISLLVVFIIMIWYITTMNGLRRSQIKISEALSDIDVALMKRHDVLVKMLDVTKAYARYEKETILETIKLRSGMRMSERTAAVNEMDQASRFINAVAENYPELRSSENYKQLQISIMDVEEHLQAARRLYNSNISYLNQKIVSFPGSIVASQLNITRAEFLETDEANRQDVKMDL
jgi:LemA protein